MDVCTNMFSRSFVPMGRGNAQLNWKPRIVRVFPVSVKLCYKLNSVRARGVQKLGSLEFLIHV